MKGGPLTDLVLPELGSVRIQGALDVRLWGQGLGQQVGCPGPLSPAAQRCGGSPSTPPCPPGPPCSGAAGPTCQQALDGEQDGADIVEGRPLVLEDVEADVALGVDVGVVAGRQEPHRGRGVGVPAGELQRQLVPQLLVGLGGGGAKSGPGATAWSGGGAAPAPEMQGEPQLGAGGTGWD